MACHVATSRSIRQSCQQLLERIGSADQASQVSGLHIAISHQFLHHAATRRHGYVDRCVHLRGDPLCALDRVSDEDC